jgi:DNA-binding GntR family transcriptional regulator
VLAYEAIRLRIANGTYGPGYRLVIDQLAAEFDISPMPVREAIRRLEAEGYLVFRRNVGAQVASIDVHEYAEVMEVLAVLEAAATALALPHLTPRDLDEARGKNAHMRDSLAAFDPLAFTRANHEFHQTLYSRCPNTHLRGFIDREWQRLDAIRRSTFSFVPARAHDAVKEHDELLELIESGADPERIEQFVRHHRLATTQALQRWHDQTATEATGRAGLDG